MTTSTEQITALIAAGNTWKSKADQLLADRQAHQDAYEDLAEDLTGIVGDQMSFSANIDNTVAQPTNVDDGTFATIADAVKAAPSRALVTINLRENQTFEVTEDMLLRGRSIRIRRHLADTGGTAPVLVFKSYFDGTNNRLYGFTHYGGGEVFFDKIEVNLDGKTDVGEGWHSNRSGIVGLGQAETIALGARDTTITGEAGQFLVTGQSATSTNLRLHNVTLDGGIVGVATASQAAVNISHTSVTLLNGATLADSGTVGTNILQN